MPSAIVREFIGTAGDTATFRSKLREQNQTLGYNHRETMGRCSSVPTAYVVAMVMLMASFALALAGVASPLWWESWPTPRVRLRWGLWQCAPSDAKTKCDSFTGGNGGKWTYFWVGQDDRVGTGNVHSNTWMNGRIEKCWTVDELIDRKH